jgi:hypothetical protein
MSITKDINQGFTVVETAFNFFGSFPVTSAVSGAIRIDLGIIQAVAGLFTLVGAKLGHALESARYSPNSHTLETLRKFKNLGSQHVIHGALNAIRGCVEFALGVATLGIGNILVLFPYNLSKDPEFSPIVGYKNVSSHIPARRVA